MDIFAQLSLIGSYCGVVGFLLWVVSKIALFFLSHKKIPDGDPLTPQFHWYVWPAIAMNTFFIKLFGHTGQGVKGLITWRSLGVTLLFSLIANMLCVILIMTSIPDDPPMFDLRLIKILALSHIVFMVFNFFGDLISVSVTRKVVNKMVTLNGKYIRLLAIDFLGITIGYIITLLPAFTATVYAMKTATELNSFIQMGFFGNVLIPFFLIIFTTSGMPLPVAIFAIIAIFSITIPTAAYLFLIILVNTCRRVYYLFFGRARSSKKAFKKAFNGTRMVGNFLLALATFLTLDDQVFCLTTVYFKFVMP